MSNLFNTDMTSSEARYVLFGLLDGKTEEEIARLYEEYFPIARAIRRKESELAAQGWMCSG